MYDVHVPDLPSNHLSEPCVLIIPAPPLTMSPCINWLQPLLALISSPLVTRGHHCPPRCSCSDHYTVDCSGRGLTRVPDVVPLSVRRLLLSNNWISWIPSDFLILYSDLTYLDLRNNSLLRLDPLTLSTSSRLVFLDLGNNNLTEIASGTFVGSRSLIKLGLGNNPYLNVVGTDTFMGLTALRELDLQSNGFSLLDVRVLEPLRSLQILHIEGNPWLCNCNFAKLYLWLTENRHKLPTGMEGIQCFLPLNRRHVPLSSLSEDSFGQCRGVLELRDYIIVIFSGISVSVAAIVTSFLLASTVNCFHRLSKGCRGDQEEGNQ